MACAISKATTEIDFVGPMAVFETWHRDPVSRRPAQKFAVFTVADTREPVGGRIPDYTFESVPSPHVVVVPAQVGSPALLEWLRKVGARNSTHRERQDFDGRWVDSRNRSRVARRPPVFWSVRCSGRCRTSGIREQAMDRRVSGSSRLG